MYTDVPEFLVISPITLKMNNLSPVIIHGEERSRRCSKFLAKKVSTIVAAQLAKLNVKKKIFSKYFLNGKKTWFAILGVTFTVDLRVVPA